MPSSARSPAPCRNKITGHFCFGVQSSGKYTSYLYEVPCTTTDRSRKPVSCFFASAETATNSKTKVMKTEKCKRIRMCISRTKMYHELCARKLLANLRYT